MNMSSEQDLDVVEDLDPTQEVTETAERDEPIWHPAKKVGFRFLCIYFLMYVIPFPLSLLPWTESIQQGLSNAWAAVTPWVGKHVLHLGYEVATGPNGSGDTTSDYIQLLVIVAVAVAGCLLWTLVDRKRPNYRGLSRWLIVGCRYYLAMCLMLYGFFKLFKTQFPYPSLYRLIQPYGESSPMGLVWTFMGYSKAYNIFAGFGEVGAGVLLLFRRTTTLGALVGLGVMGNVAMLNYAFDVPVKLFSTNLWLMLLALALLDAPRLVNVFFLNRTAKSAEAIPHFESLKWRRVALAVKILLVGTLLYGNITGGLEARKKWGEARTLPPLHGLYEVDTFVKDGETHPPLITDEQRWRYLIHDYEGFVQIRLMTGQRKGYGVDVDEEAKTLTLSVRGPDDEAKYDWTYEQPTPEKLVLTGEIDGSSYTVEMTKKDVNDFLLVSRGYNWINEYPFNR